MASGYDILLKKQFKRIMKKHLSHLRTGKTDVSYYSKGKVLEYTVIPLQMV